MDTRLNTFTKTEQVEFIPVSLCHNQFIKYRHYCLSLARPNDMKMIIVQECRGLSWNLQKIIQQEKTRENGLFIRSTVIHIRATQHFHHGLLLDRT